MKMKRIYVNEENELPKFKIYLFSLPRNLCECNVSTYSCPKNTLEKDMWFLKYV
jgi:hypothetical protein